jgi:hypothetical protein
MKVICAGFPKTGTKSLASALRILGYTVHDVEEQWMFHIDEYIPAVEDNKIPDFSAMYANVDAVTDTPACFFGEEIFKAFPDAKVILMTRDDEEVWLKSLLKTEEVLNAVMSKAWIVLASLITPTGRKHKRLMAAIDNKLKQGHKDPSQLSSALKEGYRNHNARIKAVIPQDQLLVFNVKQGWKPLCEFLGVEVPDVPFPRRNVNSEYIQGVMDHTVIGKRMFKELVSVVTILFIAMAVLLFKVL